MLFWTPVVCGRRDLRKAVYEKTTTLRSAALLLHETFGLPFGVFTARGPDLEARDMEDHRQISFFLYSLQAQRGPIPEARNRKT